MFDLGLSKVQLGVMAALIVAIPVAYGLGRWHQKSIDAVKWELAVTQSRLAAEKAAGEAVAAAATQVAEAEGEASRARALIADEAAKSEEAIRLKDKELADAQKPDCPDATGFGDDELGSMRNKYPAGPVTSSPVRKRTR